MSDNESVISFTSRHLNRGFVVDILNFKLVFCLKFYLILLTRVDLCYSNQTKGTQFTRVFETRS